MNLHIREFKEDDFNRVVELLGGIEPWKTDKMDSSYYDAIFGPEAGHKIQIALINNIIIGVVAWLCIKSYPYGGYIRILGVSDSHRRQGIGRKLLEIAEEDIFGSLKNAYISVHETNDVARSFYKKFGYYEVGPLYNFVHKGQTMIMFRKTTGPVW